MTLEESNGVEEKQVESTERKSLLSSQQQISIELSCCGEMQVAGKALEELLSSAQRQHCLTVGVYESAKVMNVDPDSVVLCLLATDEEDEGDVALQIHFTLIQAFCCDNDINIVRVNDVQRLAEIVGSAVDNEEPRDMHCILVTNPSQDSWKDPALEKLGVFCEESRCTNQWVPNISFPER